MRAGQLELVLWDHMGECVGPPHMRCWQPLVYSHALLEAWGSGTRLLISDIDEYFVLPAANASLAGALQGCTGGSKAMARPKVDFGVKPPRSEFQRYLPGSSAALCWRSPLRGVWRRLLRACCASKQCRVSRRCDVRGFRAASS